ncbi:MAG: ribbon-helix-helix protein, CopG family [Chloroflexi bacterium]|nr:ribbon-helix-helix protein, CopG family [Chloroflexota bacterium]
MSQLTVRNVPEDVIETLREEAAEDGTSVNAVVRVALQEHVEKRRWQKRAQDVIPEMDALRARIEKRHGGLLDESWPLIREDRDR